MLSEKYEDQVTFVKINVDQNKELYKLFKVKSIPSIFFIKEGKVEEHLMGMPSLHKMETKVKELLKK